MLYNNHQNYLEAEQHFLNTPGKIINGCGFVYVKNEWVEESEFNKHNTRPFYEPMPKANPDGKTPKAGIIIKRKGRGRI